MGNFLREAVGEHFMYVTAVAFPPRHRRPCQFVRGEGVRVFGSWSVGMSFSRSVCE